MSIGLIGTTDGVSIKSWFASPNNQIERIQSGTGEVLLNTQVANLVTAMAGFARPSAGQTGLSASLAASLQPTVAASWK